MSKLLTALLASVFAVVTVTPVALAAEKAEPKKTMKKGEGKKKSEGKKGAPKSEPKKTMKKGAETKK